MKYIVSCLALCLLMVSCSSTPPAERQDDPPPAAVATEAAQPEEAAAPAGQAGQDVSAETFPAGDFLELPEGEPDAGALAETEYLQEIEIIDLAQEPFVDDLEDMAQVIDGPERMVDGPEVALVVETPSGGLAEPVLEHRREDEPPADDGVALVVEGGLDTVVPDGGELESPPDPSSVQGPPGETLPEAESQAGEPNMEDGSLLVGAEGAAAPEIASQEQTEEQPALQLEELVPGESVPIDVNAIQGVVTPVEPSRSVAMDNQQFLDLRYPGRGWVYLGEVTEEGVSVGTPNLTYFGRRRTSDDTSFTLRSVKPGSTILHFYKQDVLSATFIDDFVRVDVTDRIAQAGSRAIAPDYGSAVPAYQETVPRPSDYAQPEPGRDTVAAAEPAAGPATAGSAAGAGDSPVQSGTSFPGLAGGPAMNQAVAAPEESSLAGAGGATIAARPAVADATAAPPSVGTPAVAQLGLAGGPAMNQAVAVPEESRLAGAGGATTAARPAVADATDSDLTMESRPAVTAGGTNQPQADAVQNQAVAPLAVPPQDTTPSPAEPVLIQPEVPADRQQEVYLPEEPSPAAAPGNYNPQTGMDMDDLQLPWVQEELERQGAAGIQAADSDAPAVAAARNRLEEQDDLLARAQEYFYAEDYPASLDCLNQFLAVAVSDFDAAYYLKGQVLESKSSVRNIREAQKAYKQVVDSYPQSPFWKRAKNRHTYLSRFYFDIR